MYAVCPMPVLSHKHKRSKFLISSPCCCLNTAALQCRRTDYIWFMFRRYYRWCACVCHAGSCWRQNWAPSSPSTFRTSCSPKAWSYWGTKSVSMKVTNRERGLYRVLRARRECCFVIKVQTLARSVRPASESFSDERYELNSRWQPSQVQQGK